MNVTFLEPKSVKNFTKLISCFNQFLNFKSSVEFQSFNKVQATSDAPFL